MKRRAFLAKTGLAAAATLFSRSHIFAQTSPMQDTSSQPDKSELAALLNELLVTTSPQLQRFAEPVVRRAS